MNVGDLIASYVGSPKGEKPLLDSIQKTSNGVTTFRLSIPSSRKDYTVYFSFGNGETNESLEDTTAVAAFYNAKYFYEMIKCERIDINVGKYVQALMIEDEGKKYPVFLNERYGTNAAPKRSLTIDQLIQVANDLSKLHAFCLPVIDAEARETLAENHAIIENFQTEKFVNELPHIVKVLSKNYAKFFKNAASLPEMIEKLYKSTEDITYVKELPQQLRQPTVLCHGELTADKLVFDENGKLVEIREWDNVHYGSVAEDLTFLITTSASTDIRRNNFMSIFREYFYRLVDLAPTKFKLAGIKESFKKLQKYTVLTSMRLLLNTLSSEGSDEEKCEAAQRWETAVEDAINYEADDYISDNEDAFFSK